MRTNCFGSAKLAGERGPVACVWLFLLCGALAAAGPARGQSPESSAPASTTGDQPAAGQSNGSSADQGDELFPSIGDQLGSYVSEKPKEPIQKSVQAGPQGSAEQQGKQQPIVPQPATVQTLTALGAGTAATGAPAVKPATSEPVAAEPAAAATAPPSPASAAPEIADIPVAHSGDERRQQINNECANLLKLANALKAQVDKTTKDELSVSVIRQASQVEQLARKVRDEMRPGVVSKN